MNMMLAKAAPCPITSTCALAYASSCCRKVNTSMYTSLYNTQKLVMPDQASVSAATDVALKRQPDCQTMLTTNSAAEHSTAQHSTTQQSRAEHSTTQQSRAEQSRAEQSRAEQSRAEQSRAEQSSAQHSTAQHSTAQHSTAQHSTAQHSTAQRSSQGQPAPAM